MQKWQSFVEGFGLVVKQSKTQRQGLKSILILEQVDQSGMVSPNPKKWSALLDKTRSIIQGTITRKEIKSLI
eukprot:Awhi_evm2s13736